MVDLGAREPELALFKEVFGEPHPFPAQGILFKRCAYCRRELPPSPVDHLDDVNGRVSDGACRPCALRILAEFAPVILLVPSALFWVAAQVVALA